MAFASTKRKSGAVATAVLLGLAASSVASTAQAFDFGEKSDRSAKVYWKLPFGGKAGADDGSEKAHFGFALNRQAKGNLAFEQALSGQAMKFQQKPAILDVKFGSENFDLMAVDLNGINFADPSVVRLGQSDSTVIFGMEFWQIGVLAVGVGVVSWIAVDSINDEGDDDANPAADSSSAGPLDGLLNSAT